MANKSAPTIWPAAIVSILVGLVVGGVCATLYVREAGLIEKDMRDRESTRVETRSRRFAGEYQSVVNDLLVLVTGDGLMAYVDSGNPADRERVTKRASFFLNLEPSYDQIRFLDATGREVVRVDKASGIVPPARLQDKSDRPYFYEATNLPAGQIRISTLDLNVENGRVEEPYKPMLRFSTPVRDKAGQLQGVYVINVLGSRLISVLEQGPSMYQHRTRLLNPGGYWLRAASPEKEWGFQIPERQGATLAKTDPQLWAKITAAPTGQIRHAGGLFTWATVLPQTSIVAKPPAISADPFLVVGSEITAEEWAAAFANLRLIFITVGIIVIVLTASSGWFFHQRQLASLHLRENRALLQTILDNTPAIVYLKDVTGRYLFVNRQFEQVTGLTSAAVTGKTVAELFSPEIATAADRHHQSVLSRQSPLEFEETVNYPEGPHTHLAIKFPLRDEVGRVYATGGISADISDRKRIEEQLQVSAAEIKDLYNRAPCGYHSLDGNGVFTAINETELTWIGYTAEEVIGKKSFRDFLTARSQEVFKESFPVFKERGWTKDLEFELIRRDGSIMPVLLSATAVKDASGHYISSRSTLFDVTERKRAEEERDRFFNLSRDFMCIAGLDGFFKALNPAWELAMGFTTAEMMAVPFLEWIHPDDRASSVAAVERLAGGLELVNFANRFRCRDGSYRWIEWNARSFVPQQLIYATGRDVTEQKLIDEKIERLNNDVKYRAEQLETANKELEAFSYSVSHDLRAPLRHIDGFMDLLVKSSGERLDDRGRRYVKIIGDSAKQMGNLIDDLLVFSRMGRAEMHRQNVDLNQMVEQVKDGLQHDLQGRNVVWKIARLPHVEADAPMLRQVWANLIGNAIKYTRQREAAEIEIGCTEEQPGQFVFFVRDNGVGFDMEYVDKLFGVFQRLHRSEDFEGTGIGLANVRRIIHRHGGRTWAEGAVDKGATFYYTLN